MFYLFVFAQLTYFGSLDGYIRIFIGSFLNQIYKCHKKVFYYYFRRAYDVISSVSYNFFVTKNNSVDNQRNHDVTHHKVN